jgi:hypothetical protein
MFDVYILSHMLLRQTGKVNNRLILSRL